MECREITRAPLAAEILQTPGDSRLQRLFDCIYALLQGGFLRWIMHRYGSDRDRGKLWEDAKDAFQSGLMALYRKAQQKGFIVKASLKTTVYTFGLRQLLALFKKDKFVCGDCAKYFDLLFEDAVLKDESGVIFNRREQELLEAMARLPKQQRDILVMKFFAKLKSKEIAEKLGVSAGHVDNDTSKAYAALRRLLKAQPGFHKQVQ